MADTTEIKKGAVIQHNGSLFVVTDFKFVNPGKGAAFTRTKMKNITTGQALEITYKSSESVDVVQVERQDMQFLYKTGKVCSFMNNATFETIEVDGEIFGDDIKYLKEGLIVMLTSHENTVVGLQLARKIPYTVKIAPPAVKGDSASGNVTKEIELENGLILQAPIFIKEGEEIYVNTDECEYAGRVTE